MKVFHGSDTLVETVDLTTCKPGKDFGQGFYVTKIYRQAENMAINVAKRNHTQPVVSEFDFEEYAYEDSDLQILRFPTYDEAWLDFVILNRNNLSSRCTHQFDIVEGPVADNAVAIRIKDYMRGKISKKAFLEELKFKSNSHQICFCTLQSLQMFKKAFNEIDGVYQIDDMIVRQLMIDYDLPDVHASDIYFNSNTYLHLIEENTGLYLKSWTDVYKMVKEEFDKKTK
jgi:hypothetical protein